jgi:hypothetical protein
MYLCSVISGRKYIEIIIQANKEMQIMQVHQSSLNRDTSMVHFIPKSSFALLPTSQLRVHAINLQTLNEAIFEEGFLPIDKCST